MLAASSPTALLGPSIVMVALVIGMWLLTRMARRRFGVGAGTLAPDQLRIVGKRTLEPRKALYVVELGNRYVLVGAAENSLSLIDHISAEEFAEMSEVAEQAATGPVIGPILRRGRPDDDSDAEERQFATVGESFALLLDKARGRRDN